MHACMCVLVCVYVCVCLCVCDRNIDARKPTTVTTTADIRKYSIYIFAIQYPLFLRVLSLKKTPNTMYPYMNMYVCVYVCMYVCMYVYG